MTDEDKSIEPVHAKKRRGFACMTAERRAEISRKGGLAVPAHKRLFACRPGYAAAMGRKGGAAVAASKRTFARDRVTARSAGAKGAQIRRARMKQDEGSTHEHEHNGSL